MIVSKYFNIDGKCYVEASDYDKMLLDLKKSNEKVDALESELESKVSEIESLKRQIEKLASIRTRCHESARDSFDNGNYGILHIVTADELKTSNSSTDYETDRLVQLTFDAMETAKVLINATYKAEIPFLEKQVDRNVYDINDLEQIAEHLLVYCKHNRKENEQ